MPVKQVGSSLFELDQDDKNGQNGVSLLYLPLLPPMPKVGFWEFYGIIKTLQMKSGELKPCNQGSFQETLC